MITIKVDKKGNNIKKISLKGHADYAEYGSDIVCAAVSATYLSSVNGILAIDDTSIKVISNKDVQVVEVIKEDDIINKLICNMVKCLESLEKKYPNNIEIR